MVAVYINALFQCILFVAIPFLVAGKKNLKCEDSTGLTGPYLYVTVHDTVGNILKYTLDGCLVDEKVLYFEDEDLFRRYPELRSMVISSYPAHNVSEALYVADASLHNSQVLVFDKCIDHGPDKGKRRYLATAIDSYLNDGADHTYGLCFDYDHNLYASFQHTDAVLRLDTSFVPMPLPPAFKRYRRDDFFPGSFVQFGSAGEHHYSETGVRSIVNIRTNLLVANEDYNGVLVVSISTGLVSEIIPVDKPVGLHYDKHKDILFVGSKSQKYGGVVYALDGKDYAVLKVYTYGKMTHPTGITLFNDILYVGEQNTNTVVKFNVESGKFLGVVVDHLPGLVEQIILSPC